MAKQEKEQDVKIPRALKAVSASWKQADARTGMQGVPDDEYTCTLDGMKISISANGRLQVVTSLVVTAGSYKGTVIKKFDGIDSDMNIGFFKGYCEILGIEVPTDIMDLESVLAEFVQENETAKYAVTTKTSNGFRNISIVADDEEDDEDDATEDDDDDLSKKKVAKGKKVAEEDEEDEDDDTADDDNDDNDDDDLPKKKVVKGKQVVKGKKIVEDDEDEDEDNDEDDDDLPKKKGKVVVKKRK